jgi:hypothetical protein
MGGPQSQTGRYGEEKNLLPLPGMEPRLLGSSVRSFWGKNIKIVKSTIFWDITPCNRWQARHLLSRWFLDEPIF